MKRANSLRLKAVGVVYGASFFLFIFVVITSKYLAGFEWEILFRRAHVIAAAVLGILAVGFLQIWLRLRPWAEYYGARERGELPPAEIAKKSFELAYGFPASACVIMVFLLLLVSLILVGDLAIRVGHPWQDALTIPLPTFFYFALAGIVIFYSLKRLFHPVLLDLAEDDPGILLGHYDRTYHFPLFPTPFKVPIRLRLPLRFKIFLSMAMLGMIGVLFFLLALRGFGFQVRKLPAEGEISRVFSSLRSFFFYAMWAQVGISLLVSLLLSYLVAAEINRPLQEMIRMATALQKGDLRQRTKVVSEDEMGEVAQSMNQMAEELVKGLESRLLRLSLFRERAEKVAKELEAVSRNILGVMSDVSRGASDQRAAVEESSAKADELGQSAAVVARHAREIETISNEALKTCETGSFTVQQMITAMEQLRRKNYESAKEMQELLNQARRIRTVVELIDEISDQVNLLSLNAALEAAGAGETGRRFNVVAEEIIRLAESTAQSTEQVSRLIRQIISAAERVTEFSADGAALADKSMASSEEVGLFLARLFHQVEETSRQVLGITKSTEEQTRAALSFSEHLQGIEEAAIRVEANVMEVEASLGEVERIAGNLWSETDKKEG